MTQHDGNAGYTEGYRKAQADDRGNLARSLRGMVETGGCTLAVARQIFAAVHGAIEAEREFGSDPGIDNVIRRMFT